MSFESCPFFTSFVPVKSYRNILSLFLLSAYALLLLHDFIPHTHHNHQGADQTVSEAHQHHGNHSHDKDHQQDKPPESSESSPWDNQLIHAHSHSDFDGHQHELAYRAASKDKLIPQSDFVVQYPAAHHWRLPDQLNESSYHQYAFIRPLADQQLFASHGLRAPPALG
ncbi:MAG: hypothetical protein WD048_11455 [Chitinophagales bacterium]